MKALNLFDVLVDLTGPRSESYQGCFDPTFAKMVSSAMP